MKRTFDELEQHEEQLVQDALELMIETCHGHAIDKNFASVEASTNPTLRRKPAELIALMHSELSELLESFREGIGPSDHIKDFTNIEEELIDLLIRAFDMAGEFNMRIAQGFLAKMHFNRTRPTRHGKGF